ncbi:MAG: hypothetical protein ACOC5T_09915 [Elusimicrobiota bacterium]
MRKTILFILTGFFLIAGCKNKQDKTEKAEMQEPKIEKENVKLPSGKEIERIRAGSDRKKMDEIMTKRIKGKLKKVSVHPHPELLEPELREGTKFIAMQPEKGEMMVLVGELSKDLRKEAGKNATILGVVRRDRASLHGESYPIVRVEEIIKIED